MLTIIRITSQYFYRTIRVNSVYCKFNLNLKKKKFQCCAKSSGRRGRFINNPTQCPLQGTPTFANTSSVPLLFRFRGLRFTRFHFATWSSKTTEHLKQDHRSRAPSLRVRNAPRLATQPRRLTWGAPGAAGLGARGCAARRGRDLCPAASSTLPPISGPGGHPRAGTPNQAGASSRTGRRGTHRLWRKGCRNRAVRTHLCAHLPLEPALRPGLALRLQGLRGEGDSQVYPGSRPGLLPPACPPPRRWPPTSPAVGESGSGSVGARARPARLREPGARGPQHLRRRAARRSAGPERRRGRQAGTGRGGACLKGIGAVPAPRRSPPPPRRASDFIVLCAPRASPGLAGARAPRLPTGRPLGVRTPHLPRPHRRGHCLPAKGSGGRLGSRSAARAPTEALARPRPVWTRSSGQKPKCPDGLGRGKELS